MKSRCPWHFFPDVLGKVLWRLNCGPVYTNTAFFHSFHTSGKQPVFISIINRQDSHDILISFLAFTAAFCSSGMQCPATAVHPVSCRRAMSCLILLFIFQLSTWFPMEISTVSLFSQRNKQTLCQILSHEALSQQTQHTYPFLLPLLGSSAWLRRRRKQCGEKGCGIYMALVYLTLQIRFKVQGAFSERPCKQRKRLEQNYSKYFSIN